MEPSQETEDEPDKRVSLVIPESKKEEWQGYAEDEYGGNLSHMIRQSVRNEIEGESQSEPDSTSAGVEELATLSDKLDTIHDSIGTLDSRLRKLEADAGEDPEVNRLANRLYDWLPDERPGSKEWKATLQDKRQSASRGEDGERELQAWQGTVGSLAEAMDVSRHIVDDAIEKLIDDTKLIKETEYAGETRYWRDD